MGHNCRSEEVRGEDSTRWPHQHKHKTPHTLFCPILVVPKMTFSVLETKKRDNFLCFHPEKNWERLNEMVVFGYDLFDTGVSYCTAHCATGVHICTYIQNVSLVRSPMSPSYLPVYFRCQYSSTPYGMVNSRAALRFDICRTKY